MVHLKDILRRDVVAMSDGLLIGHPADVLIDTDRHCIGLIVLESGKTFETCVVCPPDAIASYDEDTLAMAGLSSLKLGCADEPTLDMLREGIRMKGRTVISREGHILGRIVGAEVDAQGHIIEYRMRRGFFGWLRRAQVVMPADIAGAGVDTAVARGGAHSRPGH
jgi:uncharacterized protein YrrD